MELIELFGGIGACTKAFKNIGMNVDVADYVEIDKYAVKSYNAINGTNFEPQDIKEWDKDINVDIIMHGSPCQDFSVAGKQAGGDLGSGTRSSLLYETIRIVGKLRPKYVIWENVKNLLSKKHKHNFDNYIETMNILGYNSYYQVLNAKDYGIPQNRERVYTISIRKDIDNGNFKFPEKEELKLRLKDMLEEKVDEKYYLTESMIKTYQRDFGSKGKELDLNSPIPTLTASMGTGGGNIPILKQYGQLFGGKWDKINESCRRVYSEEGISPTIHTCQDGNTEPKVVQRVPLKFLNRNQKNIEGDYDFCIDSSNTGGIKETQNNNVRIRKLTPKECWRLMGFDDKDFYKAQSTGNSNSQLYKQAGNSIVVNVLEKIFLNLFN